MQRIANRTKEIFLDKIDLSDCKSDKENVFNSRAIAALAIMMKCDVDSTVAGKSITDGYHDMGIDAIYLDNNQRKLFVLQSKWRNDGSGTISQEEMHSFIEGVKRILNLDIEGANAKICNRKNDIELAISQFEYQIHLIYIHTGNSPANDYAKRPLSELLDSVNDDANTLAFFEEILYKNIYTYLASGHAPKEIIIEDLILNNWGKIDFPYSGYYGVVQASAIGEWFLQHGNALFAQNIRYYKGNTDVNEGIKQVLLSEPDNFIYYNNGIKILCKSINRKIQGATNTAIGFFQLQGVSLVNGAQTAGSIGSAYSINPEMVAKANVMLQIIDLSEAPENAATMITKLSNTQNRIEGKDFVSQDPQQERIREELAFNHITYLYKSGDNLTNPEHQIIFEEAIISLACYNDDLSLATLAKGSVGGLYDSIKKPPYTTLINPSTNSFKLYNSVVVLRKVEIYLQNKKEEKTGREKLAYVHGNRFLTYCIFQRLKKNNDFDKEILNADKIMQQVQQVGDDVMPKIIESINEIFPDSYLGNLFKNATKSKKLYEKIKEVTPQD